MLTENNRRTVVILSQSWLWHILCELTNYKCLAYSVKQLKQSSVSHPASPLKCDYRRFFFLPSCCSCAVVSPRPSTLLNCELRYKYPKPGPRFGSDRALLYFRADLSRQGSKQNNANSSIKPCSTLFANPRASRSIHAINFLLNKTKRHLSKH